MLTRSLSAVAALAMLATSASGGSTPPAPQFFDGAAYDSATSIADDNTVMLVGSYGLDGLWTPQGITPTNAQPQTSGFLSADSRVIAYTFSDNFSYRYETSTLVNARLPQPHGVYNTRVTGVSGDGSVIIGEATIPYKLWRWTAGTGSSVIDIGSDYTSANAVSFDGTTIVGRYGHQPYIYREGQGAQYLAAHGGHEVTNLRAMSRDGRYFVGEAYSGGSWDATGPALRWSVDGGYESLGTLGDLPAGNRQNYTAMGISADGSIIVGNQGGRRAWIWDQGHGMRDLATYLTEDFGFDLSGWTLEDVRAISPDGTVLAGNGAYFNGRTTSYRAWIAVIPSPSGLLVFASLGVFAPRRRR